MRASRVRAVVAQAVDEQCEAGAGGAYDLMNRYGYHASITGNHQLCPPHTREEQQGGELQRNV